jgi:hypothetical protein
MRIASRLRNMQFTLNLADNINTEKKQDFEAWGFNSLYLHRSSWSMLTMLMS